MPRSTVIVLSFSFVLALGGAAAAQDQPADPPPTQPAPAAPLTGEQILAKMAETYRACKSYQDEGVVTTLFDTEQGKWTKVVPFRTWFARPDKLRYEFTHKHGPGDAAPGSRWVVWADGTRNQSWWEPKGAVEEFTTIEGALSRPVGISGGASVTIPAMLVPFPSRVNATSHLLQPRLDFKDRSKLFNLRQPKLTGEEVFDGHACYMVEGKDSMNDPTTVWVDKERFVVRRIFEKRRVSDFTTEETTTYRPTLDEPIPDSTFTFDPSERKDEPQRPEPAAR